MGMTNGQFKSLIRLLLSDIKDVEAEKEIDKMKEKLTEIRESLQAALED